MTRTIAVLTIALLIGACEEVQTSEWGIIEGTDEWGDPDPSESRLLQSVRDSLTIRGKKKTILGTLFVDCPQADFPTTQIFFIGTGPNLGPDRTEQSKMYKVPTKIDGIKTKLGILHTIPGSSTLYLRQPRDLIRAKESLEILFAWGTDGQRQSLT